MAKREEKGSAGSFSRGAELWMHQARLFVVAIWTVVLISILAGLGVTTAYFWNATTADEKYALERNVLAHTRDALYMTAGKMELNVNGELRKLEVSEVALLTDDMADDAWRKLRNGGLFGVLTSIGVVFLISLYWWGYLLVPGDYPIARVKYGYVPTEKKANGFIERDGFAISFKPTTAAAAPAPAPAPADAHQAAAPESADMLDDDDMDAPATVEVMRNENGDVIDKETGEIIKPAAQVSHAKDKPEAKPGDQGKKPNPLADAL